MRIRPVYPPDKNIEEVVEVALTQNEMDILYTLIYCHIAGIGEERVFLTDRLGRGLVNQGAQRLRFNYQHPQDLNDLRGTGDGNNTVRIYGRL